MKSSNKKGDNTMASKDISTQYTKHKNQNEGRRGYLFWKKTKDTIITPKDYGIFVTTNKNKYK